MRVPLSERESASWARARRRAYRRKLSLVPARAYKYAETVSSRPRMRVRSMRSRLTRVRPRVCTRCAGLRPRTALSNPLRPPTAGRGVDGTRQLLLCNCFAAVWTSRACSCSRASSETEKTSPKRRVVLGALVGTRKTGLSWTGRALRAKTRAGSLASPRSGNSINVLGAMLVSIWRTTGA
eukprot:2690904-Pleurochrysis_carterae.AAC.1